MDLQFNLVDTLTTKQILPGMADLFFRAGPVMGYMRRRFNRRWIGPSIQENFIFTGMNGGPYAKGGNFNLTAKQPYTGMIFTPRYYQVTVTEFLEDLEVELAGPTMAINKIRTDMGIAALTMSAQLEIDFLRHGQNLGGVNDRSLHINGLEEQLTDGTTGTWSGLTFPQYGGQTRNGSIGAALNSPVGFIAASVPGGAMNYRVVRHSYLSCVIGDQAPVLGVTSNRGMGFIAESFSPQQLVDTTDPEINWPGVKVDKATVVMSQYLPSQDGQNDPIVGNFLTTAAQGELLAWLNPGPAGEDAYMKLWIAQSPKFAFGWTGFKGARGDNQVSGQILFAGNFTGRAPRYSRILHGFVR